MRRDGYRSLKLPEFVRASRMTLMSVVSAASDSGPPLFVFKGKTLPYRDVIVDGVIVTQTYAEFLLRGSCVAVRQEGDGVDSQNFLHGQKFFVSSVRDLTSNGRKYF